jgi:hypothetical protein
MTPESSDNKPKIVVSLKVAPEALEWVKDEQARIRKATGDEPTQPQVVQLLIDQYEQRGKDKKIAPETKRIVVGQTEKKSENKSGSSIASTVAFGHNGPSITVPTDWIRLLQKHWPHVARVLADLEGLVTTNEPANTDAPELKTEPDPAIAALARKARELQTRENRSRGGKLKADRLA